MARTSSHSRNPFPNRWRFRNYLIFYRPIRRGIHAIAVFHAARNLQPLLNEIARENAAAD